MYICIHVCTYIPQYAFCKKIKHWHKRQKNADALSSTNKIQASSSYFFLIFHNTTPKNSFIRNARMLQNEVRSFITLHCALFSVRLVNQIWFSYGIPTANARKRSWRISKISIYNLYHWKSYHPPRSCMCHTSCFLTTFAKNQKLKHCKNDKPDNIADWHCRKIVDSNKFLSTPPRCAKFDVNMYASS